MAAPLYLTKGELRGKLLTRLGYGGIGAGAGMFVPMADDLLEEAQEQLFQIFTDEKGVREWELTTGVDQRWYDIPPTCDIDKIMGMWSQRNGEDWIPLTRGIGASHDSHYDDMEDHPYRYDIRVRGDTLSGEKQFNGDMTTADTSVSGGSAGFTWSSSEWEISGGKAKCNTGWKSITSLDNAVIGETYEVEYTIEVADTLSFTFGGEVHDVYGALIPQGVGTHKVLMVASTTTGFQIWSSADTTVELDNLSFKQVLVPADPQIEIWPKPDDNYQMKIEGPMEVGAFVADGDRASFDSRLILLYAIAYGKAHLNRQDAKSAMDAWALRLKQIKANQHGTREYVRRNPSRPEREVRSRPKVV